MLAAGLLLGSLAVAPMPPSHAATSGTTMPALPSGALSEETIKTRIADAGYKEVKGLTFDDGVWRTKARGGNDTWIKLTVAPISGKVYSADAPSRLTEDEVRAKLAAVGYQNISDVSFGDGLWSVDADNPAGDEVDLLVDPDDGSVISEEQN
jgi:hypothetical protein